jgi:hypothetical protein
MRGSRCRDSDHAHGASAPVIARGWGARALAACFTLIAAGCLGLGCQRVGYEALERARDAGARDPGARDAATRDAATLDAGSPEAGVLEDGGMCEQVGVDVSECDDGLACTSDEAALDPDNCATACSHSAIDRPGDDCCAPGSDATTDSDCGPICGNGVLETGEACDDDLRCFDDCTGAFPDSLLHRDRFDGSSATALDSIGAADGTIEGTTLQGDGEVDLAGATSGDYVALPGDVLDGLTDATFETWVVWRGGPITTPANPYDSWKWQRIFDFGTWTHETDGTRVGDTYFFLTPLQEGTVPHIGFKGDGGGGFVEQQQQRLIAHKAAGQR